jgi:uncharacterized protein YjbJ (UPF0337 family)
MLLPLNSNQMETSELTVNLYEEKGRLKQKFASLTDDDLLYEEGKREEIFGRHQFRLGQTDDELDRFMSSL